jgi:hypothetical protein
MRTRMFPHVLTLANIVLQIVKYILHIVNNVLHDVVWIKRNLNKSKQS